MADREEWTVTEVRLGPKHGDMSGYVDQSLRWMYSVWDETRMDWVDVGYDQGRAERAADKIRSAVVLEDPEG